MRKSTKYLVVRSDGSMRVVGQRKGLRWDEIGIPVSVNIPDGWGRIRPDGFDVSFPELPEFIDLGSVEEPTQPDSDEPADDTTD